MVALMVTLKRKQQRSQKNCASLCTVVSKQLATLDQCLIISYLLKYFS